MTDDAIRGARARVLDPIGPGLAVEAVVVALGG